MNREAISQEQAKGPLNPQSLAVARTVVGLVQGIALYALHQASEAKAWPATDGLVFAPLLVTAIFVPAAVVSGLGNLRPRNLTIWAIAATVLCAGLAFYDIFRNPTGDAIVARVTPSTALWLLLGSGLFITHSLILAGAADRRIIASYPRSFDLAWKHGLQLALAACFIGVFWGLLWLGAELFRLVKIEFLAELLRKSWFSILATTLAFTCAIHVTDARADIVRGARTLALTLLSWLLPIVTLIACAFLLTLPFTGLEPLWSTRRATSILLSAAAALVFLINATYRDAQPNNSAFAALQYASIPAAVALVPLVALAAYGLMLRVGQYGWSPERIMAAACITVGACFALGYVLAAARPRAFLATLAITNIAVAFVILAVIFALLTPIADPARLSVGDQIARLESDRTPPEKFDFVFLRFDSGRYGLQALDRLKQKQDGPNAVQIAQKANEALDWRTRGQARAMVRQPARLTAQERAANIEVLYPKGQSLPEGFLQQDWAGHRTSFGIPRCLTAHAKCEAFMSDLDDDGNAEVIILSLPAGPTAVFKHAEDSQWLLLGALTHAHCAGVREALRDGKFQSAQPLFKDLLVNQQRLSISNIRESCR